MFVIKGIHETEIVYFKKKYNVEHFIIFDYVFDIADATKFNSIQEAKIIYQQLSSADFKIYPLCPICKKDYDGENCNNCNNIHQK